MEDFKRYDSAEEMFVMNDCVGHENCIFIAKKDANQQGMKSGLSASMGLVGAAVAGVIGKNDALQNLYYDGLLINQTEKGIGFIPLCNKGIVLTANVAKMEAKVNNYFFISSDHIEKITIKNYSILNKKLKTLRIFLKNGDKIQVLVSVKEKEVSYHERNFARFMKKYSNE